MSSRQEETRDIYIRGFINIKNENAVSCNSSLGGREVPDHLAQLDAGLLDHSLRRHVLSHGATRHLHFLGLRAGSWGWCRYLGAGLLRRLVGSMLRNISDLDGGVLDLASH